MHYHRLRSAERHQTDWAFCRCPGWPRNKGGPHIYTALLRVFRVDPQHDPDVLSKVWQQKLEACGCVPGQGW